MPMKVRYNVIDGEVFSETRGGSRKVYIPDALGNTVALMDSTGALTDTFEYFPSGTVASRTGTTPTPFQWVGGSGYYRDNAKRVHVRARNFYVNLGRWAETDPIGFDGGDYNLYRYVKNRFVVMIDPSGLQFGKPLTPQETCKNYYKEGEAEVNAARKKINSGKLVRVGNGKMGCVEHCIANKMVASVLVSPTLEELNDILNSTRSEQVLELIVHIAMTATVIAQCIRKWPKCGSWTCDLEPPSSDEYASCKKTACASTRGGGYMPCSGIVFCKQFFTHGGCERTSGHTAIHEMLHLCTPPWFPPIKEEDDLDDFVHGAVDRAAECIAKECG